MNIPASTLDQGVSQHAPRSRPVVRGKFLFVGERKFYVRGVTYGPFRPTSPGNDFPDPQKVAQDFKQMVANGINSVRTYAVPPRWVLDLAYETGLFVMIGLPWEQHVAFLDEPGRPRDIEQRIRAGVRQCAGHPAVLCYAVGNEIPAGIVRWLGRRRVEHFISRLYRAVKAEDPGALVTYVNFPTTEYLELPVLDFYCFNVYLESKSAFESYVARLQTLAGNRPLVMTEVGLDSRRHGEVAQAQLLDWQLRSVFAEGCAGVYVFSWTDEWHRGGCDIEDWDFGVTRRDRTPKPALTAVRRVFAEMPFPTDTEWPRISVIVCTYNGGRTLRECFEHLRRLDYPDFEVIVVDDGSTDHGADCAKQYGFHLIRTQNTGLSGARNTGLHAATGEIVAYLDDDAYPDPDWLRYMAATFLRTEYVGVGGPNIPPPGGWVEECVSNSPGGPIHVLLTDREAEHIPGCNMAFRRAVLLQIGGFDEVFRVAGDDVDVCWSLAKHGWKLGFSPAAVVWHHRRKSIRGYWRQQRGYGRAEALLEKKWPAKYNAAGHVSWSGRVYGNGFFTLLPRTGRVYRGEWGTAPFQRLYHPSPGMLSSVILMPEWYLLVGLLALLTSMGEDWKPLLLALPLLLLVLAAPLSHAVASGWRARFSTPPQNKLRALVLRSVTAFLHVLQPMARLVGRIHWGLTPWRGMSFAFPSLPRPASFEVWSETWQSAEQRLHLLERAIKRRGAVVHRGGDFDEWDLQIRGGLFGSARLRTVVEEHGQGRQLTRLRIIPRLSPLGIGLILPLLALAVEAELTKAWFPGSVITLMAVLIAFSSAQECKFAMDQVLPATDEWISTAPSATLLPSPRGVRLEVSSRPTVNRASTETTAPRSEISA